MFDANTELPQASQRVPRRGGFLVDADGKVGTQTLEQWTGYSSFLYEQGLLADAGRQAADRRARLRLAVHERLPAVTRARDGVRRRWPPLVAGRSSRRVGGVRPARRAWSPVVLPAPSRVLAALWDFRDEAASPRRPDARRDGRRLQLAVALAIAVGRRDGPGAPVRRAVEPLLVDSQTIPVVAIAPLFVLWFGFGLLPKVLIVVLVTFFPIVVALLDGFGASARRRRPAALVRGDGAGRRSGSCAGRRRCRVVHRAADRVVYAVIGAVFGEYVGAREGLGIWMQLSQNAFRTDLVFGAIVVTAIVSVALYVAVGLARAARSCRGRRPHVWLNGRLDDEPAPPVVVEQAVDLGRGPARVRPGRR